MRYVYKYPLFLLFLFIVSLHVYMVFLSEVLKFVLKYVILCYI